MQEFIDIHCHLLPGVDDGPETVSDAIELARHLFAAGFTKVIATPHFVDDYSNDYRQHIVHQHHRLTTALAKENIPLSVFIGGEVHMTTQVIEQANQKTLPTLHTSNYVLLEFPFHQPIPVYAKQIFFALELNGYKPILAHPERTAVLWQDINQLVELIQDKILLQVNLGSLLGRYGPDAKRTAEYLIANQLVQLFATDSHHHRSISHVHTFLQKTAYPASLLLHENPQNILSNRPVKIMPKTLTNSYVDRFKRLFFQR